MAPNNALADKKKPIKTTTTTTTTKTSVLSSSIIEERGHGTSSSRERIHQEIIDFLKGEGQFSLFTETRCFFAVWTFLTRLSGPTFVDHHPGYLMKGMNYFPIIGTLIGIWICTWYECLTFFCHFPSSIAATICTGSSMWLTGCFHEDGLGDTSDGFGGGWSRSQILKIMQDTRLGTYGCATLLLYMVTKLELYQQLHTVDNTNHTTTTNNMGTGPAIIISQTLSRLVAVYMIKTNEYIDEGGPKTKYYHFMIQAKYLVSYPRCLMALLYCYCITTIIYGPILATILIVLVVVCGHCAGQYGTYILGGVMGDFLGATICITELIILIAILMKDSILELYNGIFQHEIYQILFRTYDTDQSMKSVGAISERLWKDLYHYLWQNQGGIALIRFVVMIVVCILWSRNVGHPDVLVRDTAILNMEKDDDEIRIGLELPTSTPASSSVQQQQEQNQQGTTERTIAQLVLDDPKKTFQDKYEAVRTYLDQLAKPVGSLGILEDWSIRITIVQKTMEPIVPKIKCLIFAGDHGLARSMEEKGEQCSAYPQSVTRSILNGLQMGIAGASVLAQANQVDVHVVDVGVVTTAGCSSCKHGSVIHESKYKVPNGTNNCCTGPAMSLDEMNGCIQAGRDSVQHFITNHLTTTTTQPLPILVLGEVGIGNTTTSSLLLAALTNVDPEVLCDGGATTGRTSDTTMIKNKKRIVQKALLFHKNKYQPKDPFDILRVFGGTEIVALVGSILEASKNHMILIIDGFIVTVAALFAVQIEPTCCQYLLFASQSTERGYQVALRAIQTIATSHQVREIQTIQPALNMNLRMGEATGAILVVPIIRSAIHMINNMGTIREILAYPTNESNDDDDDDETAGTC